MMMRHDDIHRMVERPYSHAGVQHTLEMYRLDPVLARHGRGRSVLRGMGKHEFVGWARTWLSLHQFDRPARVM